MTVKRLDEPLRVQYVADFERPITNRPAMSMRQVVIGDGKIAFLLKGLAHVAADEAGPAGNEDGAGHDLPTPITIFEPNDVVLFEVRADLYLNEDERRFARVLDSMAHPHRDEYRLVLAR